MEQDRDVEVIQVVHTRLKKRGKGVEDDPVRRIEQYWSLDGTLLAEYDPFSGTEAKISDGSH
jgi:hypothetical protein